MQVFQQLLGPIGTIFHYVFYLPVYNILMVLYQAFHLFLPSGAFALAIVVLTLLLRAALIPLTRKQLKSSRAMQVIQPQLKELQARYKNRPQELMAAQQALYKEHGVNPVSGCLPLLIQMPFIYALYGAFETVIYAHGTAADKLAKINGDLYSFVPHLQQLPDTFFFWANLAQPDPLHILPILAAVLTFLQLRMALPVRKPATAGQKDTMSQATGMMQYVMPIMTLVIGLTFAAGLALYWCVSTLFSAVQQYFISGWGSLFVGIPGMEHLVPEPQQPAAPTPTRAVSVGAARALTPSASTTEPAAGGLRGMLKQIKEQLGAVQQNALETQKARQSGAPSDASKAPSAAKTATGPVVEAGEAPSATKPGAAPRRERPRSSRAGPTLVKPPAAKTATEAAPEAAAPETTSPAPIESEPLSHAGITHIAPNGNAANGVSDKSGKNGNHVAPPETGLTGKSDSGKNGNVPAASGAKRAAASVSSSSSSKHGSGHPPTSHKGGQGAASGQRKSSGTSGNKGARSSAQSRGGRPKGGR